MEEPVVNRDFYLNQLVAAKDRPMVKVVTGIRRAGKSMLVFRLFRDYLLKHGVKEDHIVALDLETQKNKPYRDPQRLYEFVVSRIRDRKRHYVLLDEIQLVEGFEDVANGLMVDDGCDVYLTGSNAKLLSRDIDTRFRGRSVEIKVHPLSFAECLAFPGANGETADRSELLRQFMLYGGMPYVWQLPTHAEKAAYLDSLNSTVLFRDLIERYGIRNEQLFAAVLDFLCSNIGSYVSAKKIADTMKSNGFRSASCDTVGNYLEHLCDAFLFHKAKRYDLKGKAYLKTLDKYYASDLGIRNARLNFRQIEPTHALENLVYLELIKRGYRVDVGKNREKEIDFVVGDRSGERIYIQSAYTLMGDGKREQELSSFRGLDDGYRKIVVTMDDDPFDDLGDGYRKINIFDFLLDDRSLERGWSRNQ
ncbi:MAG: ATP-binding protein [Fibrobacterales bacterium]|nr:ATP-binding protein [Fibrobacterales bacterium]